MNAWSPDTWDNISTVGLAVMVCAFLTVSYIRGWLIPGKHHREIVDSRDAEIGNLKEKATEDAATIRILSTALGEKVSAEEITAKILSGIKEALGR